MQPQQIHGFLRQLFQESNCQVIDGNKHYMTVQLTVDMDKRIMNRPYYWQYIESVNGAACPAQLTLITDGNKLNGDIKGEIMHFGSPRLRQLFQVTNELGSFVRVFEKVSEKFEEKTILTPWLCVNYKVSYISDQTKEMLYSLGLNLMTGYIVDEFQESIQVLDFECKASTNTFNLPFNIPPVRGLGRLDLAIERVVQHEDHQWAVEAKNRLERDQEVLEHFYHGVDNKPVSYETEKQAMEEQFEPSIQIDVVNGGLFYLNSRNSF